MPKFSLDIPHALPADEVQKRLDRARTKLESDYGATCNWDNDRCLVVARKGLNAKVALEPEKLHVDVDLGLLFTPMAGAIKNGITKQLTELLAAGTPPPPTAQDT